MSNTTSVRRIIRQGRTRIVPTKSAINFQSSTKEASLRHYCSFRRPATPENRGTKIFDNTVNHTFVLIFTPVNATKKTF